MAGTAHHQGIINPTFARFQPPAARVRRRCASCHASKLNGGF
jgi:hypothetical protein